MLTALALAGLVGVTAPGPASANSSLVVQWSLCVATTGPYAGGLDCAAHATGGTAPYTYVWTPEYYPGNQWPVTGSSVRVGCNPGTWSTVALTVTDSAGRVAYGGGGDWCNIPGQDPV